MHATSIISCNAVSVLLTTFFNFRDGHAKSIYLLSLLSKITRSPPCEPPHYKFTNEALLKQIKAAFDMSSIFGNVETTSLDLKILINLFAVIMPLIVASLIELLSTFPASVISGLV